MIFFHVDRRRAAARSERDLPTSAPWARAAHRPPLRVRPAPLAERARGGSIFSAGQSSVPERSPDITLPRVGQDVH